MPMTNFKLSKDIQEFLDRQQTVDFLRSARQFIYLLELSSIGTTEFIRKSHDALVNLYATGYALEQISLKYSSADSDFDREALFVNKNAGVIFNLEQDALYWEIFDPAYSEKDGQPGPGWKKADKEASQGWLVDDFLDIYQDLKIELNKIDTIATDEAVEDALWQLKWGFHHHWGNHCVNAMRYLHYWYYDGKDSLGGTLTMH